MRKIIKAVIPIRAGSQRVKNKNLRNFNEKNLLIHKIEKLKRVDGLSGIIVNTDSDEAIEIAKKYKVNFWKRDSYFASSKCLNSDFWQHIADTTDSDHIMFTNCTSPLVKLETYNSIIEKYNSMENSYDSLNTVSDEKQFLYLKGKPLNFDPKVTPNSQDLPDIVKLNFAVNVISKKLMSNKKSVIGGNPLFLKLDEIESVDIDTTLDFEFAEFLHKKYF